MRRVARILLLVPLGMLVLLAAVLLAEFQRGTRAETARRIPADGANGPVCYVYQKNADEQEVRCAIRLAAPMDQVWAILTDYEHFGDICSCVHADRITHEPDGTCRLEARARSLPPGQMPFAVEMRHEQMLDQYVSSWDQPTGNLLVNRGQWMLTPVAPGETLLEVGLEVQVRHVPTFILRNLSMSRLREVALAVERRLREGPSGKTW